MEPKERMLKLISKLTLQKVQKGNDGKTFVEWLQKLHKFSHEMFTKFDTY